MGVPEHRNLLGIEPAISPAYGNIMRDAGDMPATRRMTGWWFQYHVRYSTLEME